MKKWIDDDTNFDAIAIETIINKNKPIVRCCQQPEFHIYGYVHSNNRGSLWAWCSNCRRFVHLDGVKFPDDFQNFEGIEFENLCAVPEYLEKHKEIVDKQLEKYIEFKT